MFVAAASVTLTYGHAGQTANGMPFVLMGIQCTMSSEPSTTFVRPACPCTNNMTPVLGDTAATRILGAGAAVVTSDTNGPGSVLSDVG